MGVWVVSGTVLLHNPAGSSAVDNACLPSPSHMGWTISSPSPAFCGAIYTLVSSAASNRGWVLCWTLERQQSSLKEFLIKTDNTQMGRKSLLVSSSYLNFLSQSSPNPLFTEVCMLHDLGHDFVTQLHCASGLRRGQCLQHSHLQQQVRAPGLEQFPHSAPESELNDQPPKQLHVKLWVLERTGK